WWTGWTAGVAKAALGGLAHVEVGLDGGATGLVLAEEDEPTPAAETWVALLPALDSTVMGWQGRDWYLGDHGPALFDRNGNAGPTVWADGRIVGGWAQRRDGAIALRFLEDTVAATEAAVHDEADRLMSWLGPVRFTPRFRTPLERELSA
ncbi:MAG: winged helix DNA-binding domain-containing protein, partial [Acidimicrobiia bacterium]|nr:winged helix DNA-binding domain-containing protein [Acidimicrobiia bacterium]